MASFSSVGQDFQKGYQVNRGRASFDTGRKRGQEKRKK